MASFEELRSKLDKKYRSTDEVDQSYVQSFLKDAESYLGSVGTSYDRMQGGNREKTYGASKQHYDDLKTRSWKVRRYLKGGGTISADKDKLLSALDEIDRGISFGNYALYRKASQLGAGQDTLSGQQEKTKRLEQELRDLEADLEYYQNETPMDWRSTTDRQAYTKGYEDRKAAISAKQAELNTARRVLEGMHLSMVADPASDMYDPDFKAKSQYASTVSKGLLSTTMDRKYEYINDRDGSRRDMKVDAAIAGSGPWEDEYTYEEKGYDHLTEEEVAVYNYYYAQDRDKADQYLESLQDTLNWRIANARFAGLEGKTALELMFAVEAGLDQASSGFKSLLRVGDEYIPTSATQVLSGMVREDLGDDGFKLPEWMGGASVAQMGYDAINSGANMLPSLLASTAANIVLPGSGAFVGGATMGASTFGNAYQQMVGLGYTPGQAGNYAALTAASEVGLQYLLGGISSLGGKLPEKAVEKLLGKVDNAIARVAIRLGANSLGEFSEEYLQEVLTPWFENIALDSQNDIDLISGDALYAGLLGAVTSLFMEGPGTVVGEFAGADPSAVEGVAIPDGDVVGDVSSPVVQAALEMFRENGAVSNREAEAVLADSEAVSQLQSTVGLELPETKAGRRAAVKEAVGRLAHASSSAFVDKGLEESVGDTPPVSYADSPLREGTGDAVEIGGDRHVAVAPREDDVWGDRYGVLPFAKAAFEGAGEAQVDVQSGVRRNASAGIAGASEGVSGGFEGIDGRTSGEDAEGYIRDAASAMGIKPVGAEVLVQAYHTGDGIDAVAYSHGIREAYEYGAVNMPFGELATRAPFASLLTEHQRKVAYELGQMFGGKKTAKEQAIARKNRKADPDTSRGKVHFDGDRNSLSQIQRSSLDAMEMVAKTLGVQIHVFQSEGGNENGWYDPKDGSIHIDLNAGMDGKGTMLFTVAHELTHFIRQWSSAKFRVLADFLVSQYAERGVSVTELVKAQQDKAAHYGVELSWEEAYEEMVADAMETMLTDGNVVRMMADLRAQDRTLWEKIRDWFRDMEQKIRDVVDAYKGVEPDSKEGRLVAQMEDALVILESLYADALADASENYAGGLDPGKEGVLVGENGEVVADVTADGTIRLSLRTYEDQGRTAFRDYLDKCVKSKRLTASERKEMLDGIERIYETCKEFKDKYAPFSKWSDASVIRDTHGKPVFTCVTPNGEYKMNIDFSLVCKKRRTLDAVFNEMSKRGMIDDFELGQKSIVKINEIIRKYGLETACALCFVDAKRFRQASVADSFVSLYNELVESLVPASDIERIERFNFAGYSTIGKVEDGIHTWRDSQLDFSHIDHVLKTYGTGTVEYKAAKYIKEHAEGRRRLLRGDFMSSGGFDGVKTGNKEILKLYNSKKGTGGPKAAFGDVQYMNEIIQKARWWTPKKAFAVGGIRVQSFSDYVPRMVFDYVQMVYDLAATKLPAHAYSKEALFVKQFGLTGIKINMSLIPAIADGGIAPGLDASGNYVWAEESFDFETAKQIQNAEGYSQNCGTICVGVSDDHIRKLLLDPEIRMVIPYHKSGLNPIVAHMNRIAEFRDYTDHQRTKGNDGKALEDEFDFYRALQKTSDPKATAEQYLRWCDDHGYTPKFDTFRGEENYYKLLTDFAVYDHRGQYAPQREVRAVFPKDGAAFGSMKDLIMAGLEEDAVIEGRRDDSLSAIVDEIQRTIPKTEAEIDQTQVDQSYGAGRPSIRHSYRDSVAERTSKALEKENAELREDVGRLKELVRLQSKLTGGALFTKSSVDAAARMLKKQNGAKGDTGELAGMLHEFYGFIAKGEELTWERVAEAAEPIARWLMDHQAEEVLQDDRASEILRKIRGNRVRLDDQQKQEATYRYGSYEEFRKRAFGTVLFTDKSNTSLDSFWGELAEAYPDIFDPDMNATDMPTAFMEAVTKLRGTTAADSYIDDSFQLQDTIRQVYDSYWRASTLRTVADAKQREIDLLKAKHSRQMEALRTGRDQKIARLKEQHRQSRERNVEGRKRTEMRHKIRGVVKELQTLLLREDKKRHVPDSLKKAVAAALDMVDMEPTDHEARIARYEALLAQETDPEKAEAIRDKLISLRDRADGVKARLGELRQGYAEIMESSDPDIAGGYDPVIEGNLAELAETIGDKPLRELSMEQLEDVYSMYKMVLTRVRDANKALASQRTATIGQIAERTIREVEKVGGKKDYLPASGTVRKFFWNNLKPVYAMEKIGSQALKDTFWELIRGEGAYAGDVQEAKSFHDRMGKQYGYRKWDLKKTHSFTSASGIDFRLTLEQIMSLYAYSRRDQALDHLRLGGFVFQDATTHEIVKDGKTRKTLRKYKVNTASAHQLTPEILAQIVDTLTAEQKAYVEEMQGYLSDTMGAKGNEVTMAMYGVKLFREKHYFPLKSAKQYMFEQNEVAGEVRIKNSGFTNKTRAHANNPVILRDFSDVWAGHIHDMAMYHAFLLPLEDFNRVVNYNTTKSEGIDPKSVKGTIQNAYGEEAVQYIKQMITDLNGGARSDPREQPGKTAMGRFKKAAVIASLSVAIQQPSALNRAKALVGDRYFLRLPNVRSKALWQELKTYAPVAVIKEMGRFDMDTGMGTVELIRDRGGMMKKLDDATGWLPAKADEWTWVQIWAAVKKETAARHPDLQKGSKPFLEAAGERFTEVIVKTQVYDSTLSRSANMRSKSLFMNMATAFMAEPTTSANMIQDAIWQAKRGYKRQAMKTARAVLDSMLLNAVLVSLVYAARDDDEDETFVEKYISSLTSEVLEGLNPLTYLPGVKDIWSLAQGFDVERADMSLYADIWDAVDRLTKLMATDTEDMDDDQLAAHREKCVQAGWAMVDVTGSFFGLPVKNIRRDALALGQNVPKTVTSGLADNAASFFDAVQDAAVGSLPLADHFLKETRDERLYEAIVAGDEVYRKRIEGQYGSDSAIRTAVKKEFRKRYLAGEVDRKTAVKAQMLYGISRDEAEGRVDQWEYDAEHSGDGISSTWFTKYQEDIAGTGISVEAYIDYRTKAKAVTGEGAKARKLELIDAMDLTDEQKDALYLSEGWAESKLPEAPWH